MCVAFVRPHRTIGPREEIPNTEAEISKLSTERNQLEAEVAAIRLSMQQHIAVLNRSNLPAPTSLTAVTEFVISDEEEVRLQLIARARRDLQASSSQWRLLMQSVQSIERTAIETDEGETRAALDAWRLNTGSSLKAIHQELQSTFPDLPSPSVTGPELARSVAHGVIDTELQRCNDLLARDAIDESRLLDLGQSIDQGKARNLLLDAQIVEVRV